MAKGSGISVWVCVVGDLQLHCACGIFEQADSLSVAHAFSGGAAYADNPVSNLEKRDTTVQCKSGVFNLF